MVQLLRKYKDILDRVISITKNTTNGKYTLSVMDSHSFIMRSTEFPNRKSCINELTRYPRKTLKSK